MKTLLAATALAALAATAIGAGAATAQPPRQGGGSSITLYDLPNYQGGSRTYNAGVDNLNDIGLNDRAQSARVQGRWRVCTDAGLRGRCVEVNGDTPNLATLGVTAAISSFEDLNRGQQQQSGGRDYRNQGGYPGNQGNQGGYGGGQGYGGPGGLGGYGPPPAYDRNNAGQSLDGAGATFFPRPAPGPFRTGDEFCRRIGFNGAIYADDRGRDIRDVLCRR